MLSRRRARRNSGENQKESSGIFIREDGITKEISIEEWNKRYPDREPIVAIHEEDETKRVFHSNITHNLTEMANHAGIYKCLWRPEEIGVTKAGEIINKLESGIKLMEDSPESFSRFDAKNGWGTYDQFLPWVKKVLNACKENSGATIEVSR